MRNDVKNNVWNSLAELERVSLIIGFSDLSSNPLEIT